ncbi:Wzz/FepE/Etk N-terminal domain-containing protein [Terriglobus tenax]|uniref:Wzz/FepE/Etk N-terminal domain-containing protein n=1 Tax=Terriglobus tenax TaxID=1111115 RepID=UPI0021DFBC2A|nr:Wzz/FepE/Etk N-terminal domain-containing protein [Terriglobus tenax]
MVEPIASNLLNSSSRQISEEEKGIDLTTVSRRLWRHRLAIFCFASVSALLVLVLVFFLPNEFTAKVSFLPPPSSSSSGLASQLNSLGGMALLGGGVKTSGDVYAGLLKSSSVQGNLVDQFHLMTVYHTKTKTQAMVRLAKRTVIDVGLKDTIVTLSVTDNDRVRARDLANAYLDQLEALSTRLAITEGAQRRRFYEERLAAEKEALATADVELKKSEEKTGLVVPGSQAQMHFQTIANLRALITSRTTQLAALLQASTEQNMDVIRLRSEIASLNAQLGRLQQGGGADEDLTTKKVPEASLEYIRKQRDVRYHETMFEILARQYETARLDEAKEGPSPQIVDRAFTPELKSGPPRVIMVLSAFILGLLASAVYFHFKDRATAPVATVLFLAICLPYLLAPEHASALQKNVIDGSRHEAWATQYLYGE